MTSQHRSAQRPGALLALVAVLFQAILFGWHHHELNFPGRAAVPAIANPAAAPQIADDDEDHCDICQVLHHLTAAPVDFAAAPPPHAVAAPNVARDARSAACRGALAFHARAPPPSKAAIG